jgi:hypothetical protein
VAPKPRDPVNHPSKPRVPPPRDRKPASSPRPRKRRS